MSSNHLCGDFLNFFKILNQISSLINFAYSELLEMTSGGKPVFSATINCDSEKKNNDQETTQFKLEILTCTVLNPLGVLLLPSLLP